MRDEEIKLFLPPLPHHRQLGMSYVVAFITLLRNIPLVLQVFFSTQQGATWRPSRCVDFYILALHCFWCYLQSAPLQLLHQTIKNNEVLTVHYYSYDCFLMICGFRDFCRSFKIPRVLFLKIWGLQDTPD